MVQLIRERRASCRMYWRPILILRFMSEDRDFVDDGIKLQADWSHLLLKFTLVRKNGKIFKLERKNKTTILCWAIRIYYTRVTLCGFSKLSTRLINVLKYFVLSHSSKCGLVIFMKILQTVCILFPVLIF